MQRQITTPLAKLDSNRRYAARLQAATIARQCESCDATFHPFPRSQGRFCSRTCAGAARMRTREQSFIRFLPLGKSKIECHVWLGSLDAQGYPIFAAEGHGKPIKAHQYALERTGQHRPVGLVVCHSCDIPACVNPNHLRWDTPKSNSQEMTRRYRWRNQFSQTSPALSLATESAPQP